MWKNEVWWKCVTHLTSQLSNITLWVTKCHSFNVSLFDASHGSLKWRCCEFHCHLRLHWSCKLFNNNAAAGFIHSRFTKWVHIVMRTLNYSLGHTMGVVMCGQLPASLHLSLSHSMVTKSAHCRAHSKSLFGPLFGSTIDVLLSCFCSCANKLHNFCIFVRMLFVCEEWCVVCVLCVELCCLCKWKT